MNPSLFTTLADAGTESALSNSVGLLLFAIAVMVVTVIALIAGIKGSWQVCALLSCLWFVVGLVLQPWTFFDSAAMVGDDSYWRGASVIWSVAFLVCLLSLIWSIVSTKLQHRSGRNSRGSGSSSRSSSSSSRRRRRRRHRSKETRPPASGME